MKIKKILKISAIIIIVPVLGFAVFLGYAFFADYKPEAEEVQFTANAPKILNDTLEYSALIWNIGYCGLSKDMDFFYDGGTNVYPEESIVNNNLEAVKSFLSSKNDVDFFLLQEVDKDSKRSWHQNQYEEITKLFPEYFASFGKNYDVGFVPLPVSKPMGKVVSGIMTSSRYEPYSSVRHTFPGSFDFPKNLFMLDRCFLVNKYKMENGKDLLIINTHNSAFDNGSLKKVEMEFLKTFLLTEYDKGNYIVVGGDWNQCPPEYEPMFQNFDNVDVSFIDINYLPQEWNWVYSSSLPTNRRVIKPYNEADTPVTLIDFFLVSPNIEVKSVEGIDLKFENSDHQPVRMVFKLKNETELNVGM